MYGFVGVSLKDKENDIVLHVNFLVANEDEGEMLTEEVVSDAVDRLVRQFGSSERYTIVSSAMPGGGGGTVSNGEAVMTYGIPEDQRHYNHLRYEVVEVGSVVRRKQKNHDSEGNRLEDSVVLDLYPPWTQFRSGKWFGNYRWCPHWINTDDDRRRFEQASGLKIGDIEICNGVLPPRRDNEHHDEEAIFSEPAKAIIEYHNIYDKKTGELKTKDDGELMEGRRFVKWHFEWEAEKKAAEEAMVESAD